MSGCLSSYKTKGEWFAEMVSKVPLISPRLVQLAGDGLAVFMSDVVLVHPPQRVVSAVFVQPLAQGDGSHDVVIELRNARASVALHE